MPSKRSPKSNRYAANGSANVNGINGVPKPVPTRQETNLERWQRVYANDPLGFVQELWPEFQPDSWQEHALIVIRDHYQSGTNDALQYAIASGHGIGKTVLSVWVVLWFLAVHPRCQVVVTANTGVQLATKTWRELYKWLSISDLDEYFQWSATRCSSRAQPETWFAAAITNNPSKPEAFAGVHEEYVCIIMDEASGIDQIIWETIEGALTSGKALWLALGNPLDPAGRFRQCFPGGRFARWWTSENIDSRKAKMADQADIQRKLDAYGEDSDYFKMRVRGEFPARGSQQLIGEDIIQAAKLREFVEDIHQPVIIGVDPARYGDCRSVIIVRKGAKIIEKLTYSDVNSIQLAGYVNETIERHGGKELSAYTFIDSVGIGAGVVDQCKERGYKVQEVFSGNPANDTQHYANKRAEMADLMKEWLVKFASLEHDRELEADWLNIQYFYNVRGQLQIESKEDMRARGVASPDIADALSYTFAEKVRLPSAGTWGPPTTFYHPGRNLWSGGRR